MHGPLTAHAAEATTGLQLRLRQRGPIALDAGFDCGAGELLALVGPSGSGKSTILRCIAGLYRPAGGRIVCGGEVWLDAERGIHLAPQQRSVGMMFQQYALFPHLSALENIRLALGHLPAHRRAARARELMDVVHLAGLEARYPGELSGGQQQRVALARSLARDPRALLLDEPFSAVDQVTRRKLRSELVQLRSRLEMPIVLVTHDLDEARMLADRMCILHHGETLQAGPPAALIERPATPLVARLVDHTNVFEAEVLRHEPGAHRTWIRWHGHELEADYHAGFAPGERIAWVIPPENVILHRRERPSRGERENPVPAVIAQLIPLGETTSVVAEVTGAKGASLSLSLPTHVARRNGLAQGVEIRVSLLKSGIHLMPSE